MTFKIEWYLDESEGLAQESLLGDIVLRDAEGWIKEHSVYLDSWLEALIRSIELLKTNIGESEIYIAEESQPLLVLYESNRRVSLSFRGVTIRANSLSEFITELRSTSEAFLEKVKELRDVEKNMMVASIRAFCSQ